MLVSAFTLLVLCGNLALTVSHPLDEHKEDIGVEGFAVEPSEVDKVVAKASAISSNALKEAISSDNADTKKHYYLFKIKEFYDFLPLYRQEDDRYLRLEIIDKDDAGFAQHEHVDEDADDEDHEAASADHRGLVKRNVGKSEFSDATLRDNINVLQTMFLRKRKRDVSASLTVPREYQSNLVRTDIGNFYSDPFQGTSGDLDDPDNNNARYVAYVPFFRVRKYYLNKKTSYEDF